MANSKRGGRNLAFAFFTTAALCGLCGMAWGAQIGATQNFGFAPAHAHLNLLGWVSLALMGAFYAGAGAQASRALGWLNWLLSTAGAITMPLGLAWLIAGHHEAETAIAAGAILALAGLATFLLGVVLAWMRPAQPA
jgi:hypothetical protein